MTPCTRTAFLLVLVCAAALSACSSAAAPERVTGATALSLRTLSSLGNYRARLRSGRGKYRMTIMTAVHSPENWKSVGGLTVVHVGAMSYVRFDQRWFAHRDPPNAYAQNNLPAFARQFYSMTRVGGTQVRRGGPCRQAGLPGRTWTIDAAVGSTFGETFSACVADHGGALLKLTIAATDAGMNRRDASEVYEITAVGGVGAFHPPASAEPE